VRALRLLLTVGFVLIVAACAPAIASPSPVTPATSAPATPSPVADLPSVLREILRAPGPYQLRMERVQTSETTTSRIEGTMRVAPGAWAAEGTRTDRGAGSGMVSTAAYALVWIGDSGYTRTDGPWIPFTGLFDHPLRLTADPDAGTFVDLGEATVGQRAVRQLGYADPSVIDPIYLLAIGNELDDVDVAVTYDLTPDGRLVRVHSQLAGWRQDEFGGGRITHEATYTVIPGVPDPIEPPDTDWTLFRSPHLPINLALPPSWKSEGSTAEADTFSGPAGTARVAVRESPATSTPEKLVDDVQADYARKGGTATGDVVPTYLGSETAIAVTYAEIDLGDGLRTIVQLVTSHRGVAYDVVWTLGAGTVQDRFDMVGDVATSWAWTDEATP
jgi:hypothetical protein